MTTKSVTITSKNQITIPSSIVRDLQLTKHRRLIIQKQGLGLFLKPEPSLKNHLRTIWDQLPPFKGTRDDTELKQSTKESWANKKL